MDNRNMSARKYFLLGFKKYVQNDKKILTQKYTPSIKEILGDYIGIHDDISRNRELEKLKKSRDDILKAVQFFTENSILFEEGIYKVEFEVLISQITKIQQLALKISSSSTRGSTTLVDLL